MQIEQFKKESVKEVVLMISEQISCTLIEACSKLQAQCVRSGNEELLGDVSAYKWQLIRAA